jgi:hypothetical protein
MAYQRDEESYLFLVDESEWGQFPGSSGSAGAGTYYFCPVLSYGVKATPLVRTAQRHTGLHQDKHQSIYGADVAGSISAHLHGYKPSGVSITLAEKLMTWAFGEPETKEVSSKAAEWADGPNVANVRHTGLRVNQATLVGNAQSGDLVLNMDTIGKEEYGLVTAQTIPADMEKGVDMQMVDCVFTVDGTATLVQSFQHQLNRNLTPIRLSGSHWIAGCPAGRRDETLSITFPLESRKWLDYRRLATATEIACTITMQGLHNGTGSTGSYTKLTRVFNRLSLVDQQRQGDFDVIMQNVPFRVLKPDSSSNGFTDTWSEV